jgi:hypothetical protein
VCVSFVASVKLALKASAAPAATGSLAVICPSTGGAVTNEAGDNNAIPVFVFATINPLSLIMVAAVNSRSAAWPVRGC